MASQQPRTIDQIKKDSKLIKSSTKDGFPDRYYLEKTTHSLDQSEAYRKLSFGERDKNKPHKTILLVGETGSGKTTLINTMINYMLDVKREDKVWFEITDDQSNRSSAHSQTFRITFYEFFLQESKTDLTIIDTPGYGDTRGISLDKEIPESLLSLSQSTEEVSQIDAVCLVIKATENRITDRAQYIFDAVQSLFGKDFAENIVLLFTHSDGTPPKNALATVKEAKVKCAVNKKNQPVFFMFDNCQTDKDDEDENYDDDDEDDEDQEQKLDQSWNRSFRGLTRLFRFLDKNKPKSLKMTKEVLLQRKQLEANVSNLKSQVQMIELKQKEWEQTQVALEKNKKHVEENKNFEYEVDVPYREKVDIDPALAHEAMSCTVCEENCHYPGCWWVKDLSWCSVMRNYHCTVCTNKCHYSKHVKEDKIYVVKSRKEKRTYEELKIEFEDKIGGGLIVGKKLEEKLQELKFENMKLLLDAFHSVDKLQMIALKTNSRITLLHIDFLIVKLKEINELDKVKTLEEIKGTA